jgi:hypothetical protein
MDGKAGAAGTGKAIILHYVDEDPFTLKGSLVIYAITPEAVEYREFFVSEESRGNGVGIRFLESTPLKKRPTEGRSHHAKDIEYMLKKECARKGKNIIRTEDMSEEVVNEMAISHMSDYLKMQLEAEGLKFEK